MALYFQHVHVIYLYLGDLHVAPLKSQFMHNVSLLSNWCHRLSLYHLLNDDMLRIWWYSMFYMYNTNKKSTQSWLQSYLKTFNH